VLSQIVLQGASQRAHEGRSVLLRLLPGLRIRAIWVGSSGPGKRESRGPFAEVEALGAGALALLDLPAATVRRLLI